MIKNTNSSPFYVAITSHDDAHLPFVQKHLDEEMLILDPQEVLAGHASLSYRLGGNADNILTGASYNGSSLENVRAVWYRKPDYAAEDHINRIPEKYQPYSRSAMEKHVRSLTAQFADAFWISKYPDLIRANNKALQLQIASSLGFRVPDTLLTNDPQAAKAFARQHNSCIVKSQSAIFPAKDNIGQFFYAQVVPADVLESRLQNLHLAPAIFQQAITTQADIRVTVVGDACYAAEISTQAYAGGSGMVRDWRSAHSQRQVSFKAYNLQPKLRKLCLGLVRELGLQYGAIDLVKDEDGQDWFLEINPNGQWAFIEEDCGLPIGQAIADLMMKSRTKR